MTTHVYPDDVVIAILHEVQSSKGFRIFPTDREQLHSVFYLLKKKYPEHFRPFRFRDKGFFYESEELDQALSNLEASKLLHRHNDTPRYYHIQPHLDTSFDEHVKEKLVQAGAVSDFEQVANDFILQVDLGPAD